MGGLSVEMIEIVAEADIVRARQAARQLAEKLGFSLVDKTRIATAVSELARNVYTHGGGGRLELEEVTGGGRTGVRCVFIDQGPGIPDIEAAITPGFSTGNGLGQGLPGSKRLMDDFKITSEVGRGTQVEVVKWKQP